MRKNVTEGRENSAAAFSRPSITFDEFRRPKGESSETGTQGLNYIFRLRNFSISKGFEGFHRVLSARRSVSQLKPDISSTQAFHPSHS